MIIRKMTKGDVPEVYEIETKCFSLPWSQQGFYDGLKQESIFLVAEEIKPDVAGGCRKVIAGYIGMYISYDEGEITNVAVAEEFRGRGLAKELVRAMQREAGAKGVLRIVLEVRDTNDAAIAAYRSCGFQEIGIRKGFYEQPREDARIMLFPSEEPQI